MHLDEIEAQCLEGDITLQDIFRILGKDGHHVLILFLTIPFLQPVPLFGLSTPFGILIAIVSLFAYFGKPPRVPQRWAQRKISSKIVYKIAEGSERIFEKLDFILHPRWKFFFRRPFLEINTFLVVLNAILLALPLPIPFSNSFPAWMIFFQILGYLEEDGLFIAISYFISMLCFIFFAVLAFSVETSFNFFN